MEIIIREYQSEAFLVHYMAEELRRQEQVSKRLLREKTSATTKPTSQKCNAKFLALH
jgi:hypothetical protein